MLLIEGHLTVHALMEAVANSGYPGQYHGPMHLYGCRPKTGKGPVLIYDQPVHDGVPITLAADEAAHAYLKRLVHYARERRK